MNRTRDTKRRLIEAGRRPSFGSGLLCITSVLGFLTTSVLADSWGPPTPEHWSANGQYVLKVQWGHQKADRMSLCQKTDKGLLERWSRGFVDDRWPPHRAYVANDGRHVVLRDQHANLGHDKVLVFLGPDGNVIRSYELNGVITQKEALNAKHTVSSVWWSRPGWFSLRESDRQFAFITHQGTIRCYDVATGDRLKVDERLRVQLIAEATAEMMPGLQASEPRSREAAACMLGVLEAKESVPALKKALLDRAVTGSVTPGVSGKSYEECGVQLAAAGALLRIQGEDAIPLVEEQMLSSGPDMQRRFLEVLAELDRCGMELVKSPRTDIAVRMWNRLSQSKDPAVRKFALAQRLERGDVSCIRSHPDLLKDKDGDIRYRAIRCLAEQGTLADSPLFQAAMNDNNDINRLWVFRGLVRIKPPNMDEFIAWGRASLIKSDRYEVEIEAARRGDKAAVRYAVDRLRDFKSTHMFEARELCELVAELGIREAQKPLRAAFDQGKTYACVAGALASFGDAEGLARTRQLARQGDALDRAYAIEWLGRIKDSASTAFLKGLLGEEEPWIREAAAAALKEILPAER